MLTDFQRQRKGQSLQRPAEQPRTVALSTTGAKLRRHLTTPRANEQTADLLKALGFPAEYIPVPEFSAPPSTPQQSAAIPARALGLHGVPLPERIAKVAAARADADKNTQAVRSYRAYRRMRTSRATSPPVQAGVASGAAVNRGFKAARPFIARTTAILWKTLAIALSLGSALWQRTPRLHIRTFAQAADGARQPAAAAPEITVVVPRVRIERPVWRVNATRPARLGLGLLGAVCAGAVVFGVGTAYLHLQREQAAARDTATRTAEAASRIDYLESQAKRLNTSLQSLEAQDGRLKALLAESVSAQKRALTSGSEADDDRAAAIARSLQTPTSGLSAAAATDSATTRRTAAVPPAAIGTTAQLASIPAIDPTDGGELTSGFGWRTAPWPEFHKGLDLAEPEGRPIQAAATGIVVEADWNSGFGRFIDIDHQNGFHTYYGHLSRFAVEAGEHVRQGQIIGFVGQTGDATGPHLHYQVMHNGVAIDPHPVYARCAGVGARFALKRQARCRCATHVIVDFSVCSLTILLSKLIDLYIALMLIYAVVSWLPGLRGRWTDYLAMVIEPVLIPIRRYIPPVYGLDLSFMIVLLVLRFLSRAIIPHECYYGSGMYI